MIVIKTLRKFGEFANAKIQKNKIFPTNNMHIFLFLMKYLWSNKATDETIDNVYRVLVLLESIGSGGGLNVGDSWCPGSS